VDSDTFGDCVATAVMEGPLSRVLETCCGIPPSDHRAGAREPERVDPVPLRGSPIRAKPPPVVSARVPSRRALVRKGLR